MSMWEYESSPPPLHHSPSPSEISHHPSCDTSPVTPVTTTFPFSKQPDRDLPWFRKPIDTGRTTASLSIDNHLLVPDFDDATFPLFDASPPDRGMASGFGIPISTRQTSTSPRGNQPSNLTSALQRGEGGESDTMNGVSTTGSRSTPIPVELSQNYSSDAGTRPISVKGKTNDKYNRRESVAQSMGMGMSWGGVSVGSWVRDEMMNMSGTSPFAFHQSPSYHSSSYLPKLEANFMRDFSCCGLTLPTLHDLLQHYEEAHAQKDPVAGDAVSQQPLPDSRAAIATNTANQIQQEAQQRSQELQIPNGGPVRAFGNLSNNLRPSAFSSTLQTIQDMDTVEDMEMDDIGDANDATPPSNQFGQISGRVSPSGFSVNKPAQVPQLNTTMMQGHQAYRNSTPNTPITSARNSVAFQGANTSSTLMANPMQQFQDMQNPYRSTPDSSAPGTPGELDEALMTGMDDMTMQNNTLLAGHQNGLGNLGFGMNNDMVDLYIDEPAKRLFQSNAGGNQYSHNRLGSGQYGANSEIAKRIREQQMLAGLPDTTTNIPPHEEPKPFRCPVIGCEKAYKNQNGLKYHKAHGHNNQRLHENGDGTFSIVNPDTQAPYPGTMGMEKEKPYKCDVCQKRYKNLNGLKYHKTHSPACNPDAIQPQRQGSAAPGMASQQQNNMNLGNLNMGGISGDSNMM